MTPPVPRRALPMIGWREWVALPELGAATVKAKIDTGARTSALHAFSLHPFERDGATWVRFTIHPFQRDAHTRIATEAPLSGYRMVRNTSGRQEHRPTIVTAVRLLGITWPIELTLARRDEMGFRMLLGRSAVRRRFLIDPGRSYIGGRPEPHS